ncbi:unnamed protein product [Nezara viridula]|uniref:Uncharacterized protein n=1 Tax=Nezara viridula TaxID=85310 RepID=A0A9P0HIY9_NEZVI|nr:unnamed protein product [Nezara viridula]
MEVLEALSQLPTAKLPLFTSEYPPFRYYGKVFILDRVVIHLGMSEIESKPDYVGCHITTWAVLCNVTIALSSWASRPEVTAGGEQVRPSAVQRHRRSESAEAADPDPSQPLFNDSLLDFRGMLMGKTNESEGDFM